MNPFLDFETLLLSRNPDDPVVASLFVRTAYEPVFRLTQVYRINPRDTEQITQDILVTAFTRLSEYTPGSNFAIWFFSLVVKIFKKEERKRGWRGIIKRSEEDSSRENLANTPLRSLDDHHLKLLFFLHGLQLEPAETAAILNQREHTILTQVDRAFRSLPLPGNDFQEKAAALKTELTLAFPPPSRNELKLEKLSKVLISQQSSIASSQPKILSLSMHELIWTGALLLMMAGIFWGVNRSESPIESLPLFPTPTPPLPEPLFPPLGQFTENTSPSGYGAFYSTEPIITANGNVIVYKTTEWPESYLSVYHRETGSIDSIVLPPPNDHSYVQIQSPDVSANGRRIVFASFATTIGHEGTPSCIPPLTTCSQIYLFDQDTGKITLVSTGLNGTPGNQDSLYPSISGNGQFVAFWSFADNLVLGDDEICPGLREPHSCGNLFIKDLETGLVEQIPVGRTDFDWSRNSRPDLSDHGEWLVFTVYQHDNIQHTQELSNNESDIIAYHLPSQQIRLINVSSSGAAGNGSSYLGAISADGRFVAFVSSADNLSKEDTDRDYDVYLHHLPTGETTLISRRNDGEPVAGPSGTIHWPGENDRISISSDGRYVVFISYAPNLLTNLNALWCYSDGLTGFYCAGLFLYDNELKQLSMLFSIQAPKTEAVSNRQIQFPSISENGDWMAFAWASATLPCHNENLECSEIYLFDTRREKTTRVSEQLASAGDDRWHFQTSLEGHDSWVNGVAISPDGQFLASGGQEGKLLLWNLPNAEKMIPIYSFEAAINAVAISPDGLHLAAGDQKGNVCIFTMPEGTMASCLEPHPGQVRSAEFSPDSQQLTVAAQGTVWVWRKVNGEFNRIREYPYPGGVVESIAYSADGQLLAAAVDQQIWVRQTADGSVIARLDGQEGNVFDLAFSPDGQYLASGSMGNAILIWKIQPTGDTWRFEFLRAILRNEWARTVAFSPDSQLLAAGSFDSSISLWRMPDGQHIQTLKRTTQDQVIDLAFSPDGHLIAAGTMQGLRLWAFGSTSQTHPADAQFFAFEGFDGFISNTSLPPRPLTIDPVVVFSADRLE